MAKRDEQAMADLTDEERKAIEEADAEEGAGTKDAAEPADKGGAAKDAPVRDPATGQFVAKDKDAAGDGKTPADDGKDTAGDDKKTQEAADKKAAGTETAAGAETEKIGDGAPEPISRRAAIPNWTAPEDAEAKIKEIGTKRDALAEKFDNGDLTAKEFNTQLADLNKEERAIERAQDRAEMSQEMRKSNWLDNVVPEFLESHTAYRDNETLHTMLDAEVRKLQAKAVEEGNDPLDPKIIAAAHKSISAAVQSLTGQAQTEKKEENADTGGDKTAAGGKKRQAPPTLAHVPSADITETDSEFAALDRLADQDPIGYESALAKLPDVERERYLRSN